jgi:hypothetical protein
LLCLIVLLLAGGCQGAFRKLDAGREAYYLGDFGGAKKQLQSLERQRRLKDVVVLDRAVVELATGNAGEAEALLRAARDRFDSRKPSTTVPSVTSLMTDERDRPYDAASYEDVMIRSLLSIASLLGDATDAEAYAMQAQMRQQEIAIQAAEKGLENVGEIYQPLALAPYVRGLIRESNHHDYDDAARAYQLVAQWQPSFRPAEFDVIRATEGTHSQPGHGVLYLFALVGRGPQRVADVAEATGPALLIADRIVAATSRYTIPPTLAPVPVPRVLVPPSRVDRVGVFVNGQFMGATEVLTDVGSLATRQLEAEMPWTVARGIVRRVAKKTVVASSLHAVGGDNGAVQLGGALLGSVWEATEQADTRCWGLLPREIQVMRVELPSGEYEIGTAAICQRPLGIETSARVVIRDGLNSFVLCVAPDDRVTAVVCGAGCQE